MNDTAVPWEVTHDYDIYCVFDTSTPYFVPDIAVGAFLFSSYACTCLYVYLNMSNPELFSIIRP